MHMVNGRRQGRPSLVSSPFTGGRRLDALPRPVPRYKQDPPAEAPMVEIPDSLVERLKSRQVVLVAGLGCNQLAGAPGWSAFTETLAAPQVFADDRAALAKLTAAGRLADAIALIRDLVPHPTLEAAIGKAYPGGAPVPESVKQAAAFPWRAIVTT